MLSSITGIISLVLPFAAAAGTFGSISIYDPPDNYTDPQVLYARPLQLADGTLLATWENYSPEPPPVWFPIVKSTDGGETWEEISQVHDTANGFGLRYQPFLYQLPKAIGDFPAGTVLLSGSSIPTDLSSTEIEVYASRDCGYTWEFVSHVAKGGEAIPNNGLTPVWEPFLMVYQDELILYYSDQRDNETYGQKLVHQTTTDLLNWSEVIDDVTHDDYYARPGMPTLAQLPTGDYIYVYEYGGAADPPSGSTYWFPVNYRFSADPHNFLDKEDFQLVAGDTQPAGSPYVVWSSWGGENGTIVVSCGTMSEIFTNQKLGDPDHWQKWSVPEGTSYTRALLVKEEDPDLVLIMGGGKLPPGKTNEVTLSVVRLSELFGGNSTSASTKRKNTVRGMARHFD